jgi:phosphotransferase system HPr (HPr) family protein
MTSCQISILNALGLHARAAAKFVHTAGRFTAHVTVARGEREVDGKSIMGLLLLAAAQGSEIRISADGPDERDAIRALCALVERGFDEAATDPPHARPFDDKAQDKP